jgi:hypothetical protein
VDDFEITDLSEVYKKMDTEGKKKMTQAAGKLLTVQKLFENDNQEFNGETRKGDLKNE